MVPLYSIFIKFENITLCTRFAVGSKGKNSNNLLYNIKECLVANRLCLLVLYKTACANKMRKNKSKHTIAWTSWSEIRI